VSTSPVGLRLGSTGSQSLSSGFNRVRCGALIVGFGRVAGHLPLSVTDVCNLRCRYYLPDEKVAWLQREEWLTRTKWCGRSRARRARGAGGWASPGRAACAPTLGEPGAVHPGDPRDRGELSDDQRHATPRQWRAPDLSRQRLAGQHRPPGGTPSSLTAPYCPAGLRELGNCSR
jgi:hypothetical protein